MSAATDKPYRVCGCVRVATLDDALALSAVLRNLMGGGGFNVEEIRENEDGSVTTKRITT